MKVVLFAGGTGKRFWPVSRKKAPKQFSPLIEGKPLLRVRVELLLQEFDPADIFISTGKRYEKEINEIAPELPARNIILEPEMRDTGPAVSLAVEYINSLHSGEIISIQWSDHLINKPKVFVESLLKSESYLIKNADVDTVLVAVPARFPSPHRGYINFGEEIEDISLDLKLKKFIKFTEKPTKEVAEEYIVSGQFGWNPGYWTIRPDYYIRKMRGLYPEMQGTIKRIIEAGMEESILSEFANIEKISADYAFAENIDPDEARVILTDMGWSDVGEWIALKEALEDSPEGNVTRGRVIDLDSKDSIIYNLDDSKLISTIGLEGMVVVNTGDVIAIFPKDENKKLKEYLKELEDLGEDQYL